MDKTNEALNDVSFRMLDPLFMLNYTLNVCISCISQETHKTQPIPIILTKRQFCKRKKSFFQKLF